MLGIKHFNNMRIITTTFASLVFLTLLSSCAYITKDDDRAWFLASKEKTPEKFVKRRMPRDNKGGEGIFLDSLPENRRPVSQQGISISPTFEPLSKHSEDIEKPGAMHMKKRGMAMTSNTNMPQMPHSRGAGMPPKEDASFFKRMFNKLMGNDAKQRSPFPPQPDPMIHGNRMPMQQAMPEDRYVSPHGGLPSGMRGGSFSMPPSDDMPSPFIPEPSSAALPFIPAPIAERYQPDDSVPMPPAIVANPQSKMEFGIDLVEEERKRQQTKQENIVLDDMGELPWLADKKARSDDAMPEAMPVQQVDVEQELVPTPIPAPVVPQPSEVIENNVLPWKDESDSDSDSSMPIDLMQKDNYPQLTSVPNRSEEKDFNQIDNEIETLIQERDRVREQGSILFDE